MNKRRLAQIGETFTSWLSTKEFARALLLLVQITSSLIGLKIPSTFEINFSIHQRRYVIIIYKIINHFYEIIIISCCYSTLYFIIFMKSLPNAIAKLSVKSENHFFKHNSWIKVWSKCSKTPYRIFLFRETCSSIPTLAYLHS